MLLLIACHGDDTILLPETSTPDGGIQITLLTTDVILKDYQGGYDLHASLGIGVLTGSSSLSGTYIDSDENIYHFDEDAHITHLEIIDDPTREIQDYPGFYLEYGAEVKDLGIAVDVTGTAFYDVAYSDYFNVIAYTAEGIVEIEALGDTVVMDTSVEYDDPDLLVGEAGISVRIEVPAN